MICFEGGTWVLVVGFKAGDDEVKCLFIWSRLGENWRLNEGFKARWTELFAVSWVDCAWVIIQPHPS